MNRLTLCTNCPDLLHMASDQIEPNVLVEIFRLFITENWTFEQMKSAYEQGLSGVTIQLT